VCSGEVRAVLTYFADLFTGTLTNNENDRYWLADNPHTEDELK